MVSPDFPDFISPDLGTFYRLNRYKDMGRLPRVVIPGIPHHVTQRGNRRQTTFFGPEDCDLYLRILSQVCRLKDVAIWSYCLMPNHVHLIATPKREDSLRRAIGDAHRRYTLAINNRHAWRGHLWQGRFASFPMDERHLLAAARYIEMNPVKAGLARHPEDYLWSSARAHLSGRDDALVKVAPLLNLVGDWQKFLEEAEISESMTQAIEKHERTGRPLGNDNFLDKMERLLGRPVRPRRPGRPFKIKPVTPYGFP